MLDKPLRSFFMRVLDSAADVMQAGVVPIDNSTLRKSLQLGAGVTAVDRARPPRWARVGSNLFYGRILDEGGPMRGPGGPPPTGAIEKWAGRVGVRIPPAAIAKAIGKRGPKATEPHYASGPSKGKPTKGWFSDTIYRHVEQDVHGPFLSDLAKGVEAEWRR